MNFLESLVGVVVLFLTIFIGIISCVKMAAYYDCRRDGLPSYVCTGDVQAVNVDIGPGE
jgi:hypothetical protein